MLQSSNTAYLWRQCHHLSTAMIWACAGGSYELASWYVRVAPSPQVQFRMHLAYMDATGMLSLTVHSRGQCTLSLNARHTRVTLPGTWLPRKLPEASWDNLTNLVSSVQVLEWSKAVT